jgi:hypothetical protein
VLTTAVSIFAAIALLMPGFIIAELSLAGAARSSRSDLELALRAIAYALVVHLIFGFWTVALVNRVEEAKHLPEHLVALSAYTAVVLLGAPMILGLVLKAFLGRAELRDGRQAGLLRAWAPARREMPSTTPFSAVDTMAPGSSWS